MADLQVSVTSADLRRFYLDLKAARANLMPDLRRAMRDAARPLVTAVQESASWSTRIPGATSAKVSFAAKSAGLSVKVDATKAPEARPLNNKDRAGTFRHPVWADAALRTRREWTWVTQAAQPFWQRGLNKAGPDLDSAMAGVLDELARRAGFR